MPGIQTRSFLSEKKEGREEGRGNCDSGAATMPGQPNGLEEGYITNHLLTLPALPPPLPAYTQLFLTTSSKEGQTTWSVHSKALEALVAHTPTSGTPESGQLAQGVSAVSVVSTAVLKFPSGPCQFPEQIPTSVLI